MGRTVRRCCQSRDGWTLAGAYLLIGRERTRIRRCSITTTLPDSKCRSTDARLARRSASCCAGRRSVPRRKRIIGEGLRGCRRVPDRGRLQNLFVRHVACDHANDCGDSDSEAVDAGDARHLFRVNCDALEIHNHLPCLVSLINLFKVAYGIFQNGMSSYSTFLSLSLSAIYPSGRSSSIERTNLITSNTALTINSLSL